MPSDGHNPEASTDASAPVTRFAPSPTGRLHIGGARTALYNWLHARQNGGRFLLRIENTDRARSRAAFEDNIRDSLRWLGLGWDDEPLRQSERGERYRERLEGLLAQDQAYRCTCTPQRLEELREQQMAVGQKPGYDGRCRHAGIGADSPKAFTVRLRTPAEGSVSVLDSLRGRVSVANSELDDLVLARSDGSPTYHLCVVVDDIDSAVSHIIRGDDHLNNALRQAHLYEALGEPAPRYTHLPLIHDESGKRYSKRTPGSDILFWRRQGLLPQALLNYLLRLGWAHGDDELFTIEQMLDKFNLAGLNRSSASFNQGKLEWLNRRHMQSLAPAQIRDYALDCLDCIRAGAAPAPADAEPARPSQEKAVNPRLIALDKTQLASQLADGIVKAALTKAADLVELLNLAAPLAARERPSAADASGDYNNAQSRKHLAAALEALASAPQWDAPSLPALLKSLCQSNGLKMPQLAMPLRLALLGELSRLGIGDILVALGREESLARIRSFLDSAPS